MFCSDIITLKKYIPTILTNDFSKYETEIREANTWLKKNLLGTVLFEKVSTEGFNQEDAELVRLCEVVVARKGYLEGIPSFDLTETAGGFVITRNENQAPASPERVKKLQESIASRLTDAIENLLEYIEEHPDYHNDWKGSATYSLLTDVYIHTLTQFRRYAPWPGTRQDWIAAKPAMIRVIKLQIEPVISSELSGEVIEELRGDDLSDSNKTIIEDLRFAFASYVTGQTEAGNSFLYRIRKRLMASPTGFPAWNNSELYATLVASTIDKYKPERPIFRAGF